MLTQIQVKRKYDYNFITGLLTHRDTGNVVGGNRGVTNIKYVTYKVSNIVWLWMTGKWPTNIVDHINGMSNYNAWINLRQVTKSGNCLNKICHREDPSVGITYRDGRSKPFVARYRGDYLGSYATYQEAYIVRQNTKLKHTEETK